MMGIRSGGSEEPLVPVHSVIPIRGMNAIVRFWQTLRVGCDFFDCPQVRLSPGADSGLRRLVHRVWAWLLIANSLRRQQTESLHDAKGRFGATRNKSEFEMVQKRGGVLGFPSQAEISGF